jgi:hypothetical protein
MTTDTLRVIDPASATELLKGLRQYRWSWRSDDFHQIADQLGWTDFEIINGKGAFATTPAGLGGRELEALIRDGRVETIKIRVADRAPKKSNESLIFMHESWSSLVALATDLFGKPTRLKHGQNPDAQWRGEESTIGLQNVKIAVVLNWANNAFQDGWNSLRRPE